MSPLSRILMAILLISSSTFGVGSSAISPRTVVSGESSSVGEERWPWPISPTWVTAPFVAPAHEFAPGHRGVDVRATLGTPVRAPAAGVVAFSGTVAGRGVVTIDHGDGIVTTLEPVAPGLRAGTPVHTGDVVAEASRGGHAAPGDLHIGVRRHGRYIDPRLIFEKLSRAVLLPCC